MTKHSLIIPDSHAHARLDQALAQLLPEYSRTQIQTWLKNGDILINGLPMKGKTIVKGGEAVEIHATLKPQPQWTAQAIPLNIVYEDESLVIVNKPVGMVVHPGAGVSEHTLLNALLHHAPVLQTLPRAGILHRLDKNTSGLLIVAKTQTALTHLSRQLKKRAIVREYQTIVQGILISGGTIDAPIGRHALHRKRMAVTETGKKAITHYRIKEKYRAHTRLTVRLETGRTHQIRVHMAHIHHPIVGDTSYAINRGRQAKGMTVELRNTLHQFKRQALHAFALGFTHPVTQEWMHWEIELPEDMQLLIEALKKAG
ncbi:MAG TPA: 23S rRNA pseudouridine(1911/1915/1917) synthase RluD [Gammaproteobacteria bacterium]|jgi:23S rRNA pseudouridine1911/1915/1917 synthase|nr:23S rRNA pseudouridine(1911/1915/1917) synthase RluD [Gammaproteobacteria bacterium]